MADAGALRAPARVVNHLDESLRFLTARGYPQLQLLASYPGYLTGLMFHKYEEKPEEHKVYLCLPEPNNPHDSQALAILSSRNQRIAFVPKVFTEQWSSTFPGLYTGACWAVAYVTSPPTAKSAQCIYNIYFNADPQQQMPPFWTCQQTPLPAYVPAAAPPLSSAAPVVASSAALNVPCTVCRGPANRFILPCRHYACCASCSARLLGQACPTCQQPVRGTTTF